MKVLIDMNDHLIDVMAIESVGPSEQGGTEIQMLSGRCHNFTNLDPVKTKKMVSSVLVEAGKRLNGELPEKSSKKVTPLRAKSTRKKP